MSDGYDIYCFQKLNEAAQQTSQFKVLDEVACACANYLETEGYKGFPNNLLQKQSMSNASQIVPNTSTKLTS